MFQGFLILSLLIEHVMAPKNVFLIRQKTNNAAIV